MEFLCEKGDRVLLTTQFASYEGDVKYLNPVLGRICLSNAVQYPEGIIITGYRNFDSFEIEKLVKLDKKEFRDHYQSHIETDHPADIERVLKIPKNNQEDILRFQCKYKYIKDLGRGFQSAVALLEKSERVGVCAKDVTLGRSRRASVVAVSTDSDVFLFDLKLIGDGAFDEGLRRILESDNIVKVVHDARLMSDCLKRKHLVSMENVLDVEAEDIMMVHQERMTIRKHSRSLSYLARVYLRIPEDSFPSDECSVAWSVRPLSTNLQRVLGFSVSVLLPLQKEIERKFTQRLVDASRIYNTHLRNSDLYEFIVSSPEATLRKQMIELVKPKSATRCEKYRGIKKLCGNSDSKACEESQESQSLKCSEKHK